MLPHNICVCCVLVPTLSANTHTRFTAGSSLHARTPPPPTPPHTADAEGDWSRVQNPCSLERVWFGDLPQTCGQTESTLLLVIAGDQISSGLFALTALSVTQLNLGHRMAWPPADSGKTCTLVHVTTSFSSDQCVESELPGITPAGSVAPSLTHRLPPPGGACWSTAHTELSL